MSVCHVPTSRSVASDDMRDFSLPWVSWKLIVTNFAVSLSVFSSSQNTGSALIVPSLPNTEFCVSLSDCMALAGSPHTAWAVFIAVDLPMPDSGE